MDPKFNSKITRDNCYKGTRVQIGNAKRLIINKMIDILWNEGYDEISIPIIQFQSIFSDKVGAENNNLMFNFKDRGNRDICLAPEYTAVVQKLSGSYYKYSKDVKLFYVQECFRGENPQAGRYRQFTQLGVEIINPTKEYNLSDLALNLIDCLGYHLWLDNKVQTINSFRDMFELNTDITRGLDYYKGGKGFEIYCNNINLSVCGGGEYEGGVGFAIGIDRLMTLNV